MKTLVVGAAGQLGRDLVPRLPGEVIPLSRAEAELTNVDLLRATLATHRPDLVINCAAYNFVDKAETEPEVAFANNAFGVRNLALACRDVQAKLIHFSTDYVFGLNEAGRPLSEEVPPVPVGVYGASKLAGEHFVRTISPENLVLRVCGLYGVWGSGGKGGNFVETMLRVAGQGKPLKVVADQRCTPTSTRDVATATLELIGQNASGLFHLTNRGECSWFEFAAEIFRLSGLSPSLTPITSAEFGAPAKRPAFSVLDLSKLHAVLPNPMRPWPEALAEYLAERTPAA